VRAIWSFQLGAQPPIPSWGEHDWDHYQYIIRPAYLAVVLTFTVMLVMAFICWKLHLQECAVDVKTTSKTICDYNVQLLALIAQQLPNVDFWAT
jgi:hypothetical protein